MDRHFHEELRDVQKRFSEMGALVQSRARDAVAALSTRDADLAAQVTSGDAAVNGMELEVDDLCFRALALHQPVASDLRFLRSVIKANTDLERVGDQAVNIAEAAIDLIDLRPMDAEGEVASLADLALAMLDESLRAFADGDAGRARHVITRDDLADAMRDALIHTLVARMKADRDIVQHAQGLILVSRGLERIADHATNIAEVLIFIVEGRDVRHHREHAM
jgi:phosphate transport system protein